MAGSTIFQDFSAALAKREPSKVDRGIFITTPPMFLCTTLFLLVVDNARTHARTRPCDAVGASAGGQHGGVSTT